MPTKHYLQQEKLWLCSTLQGFLDESWQPTYMYIAYDIAYDICYVQMMDIIVEHIIGIARIC